MTRAKKRVAILGASGYGGSELIRMLLGHAEVEVARITSRQHAGLPVWKVHPYLNKVSSLVFEDTDPAQAAQGVDLVFSALPHGASQDAILKLPAGTPVIDLSGDFRLKDAASYEKHYGHPHKAPERLAEFVYGLTEFNRPRIVTTKTLANPGCFATGVLLALMPLALEGLLDVPVALSGVTGSSGSGVEAKSGTHHPERAEAFRAYKPLTHQHLPEIAQALAQAGAPDVQLAFVPHSAPLVRGIHITALLHPKKPLDGPAARALFARHYSEERFIRVVDQPPDVAVVAGSNFADVYAHADGTSLAVLVALDNLVKGMSGQAIQNMNLMLGLPEHEGLGFPGTRP